MGCIVQRAIDNGADVVSEPAKQPWGYTGSFTDPDDHVWMVTAESQGQPLTSWISRVDLAVLPSGLAAVELAQSGVDAGCSRLLVVAVQLASRFRASCEGDAGSAV